MATTDFYQAGVAHRFSRFSGSADVFWIERSNEQVYVAGDGSAELTRQVSFSGGLTKVGNAHAGFVVEGMERVRAAAGDQPLPAARRGRVRRGVELSVGVDNPTNRAYYETQNYFESRLAGQAPRYRIHGTPGYPVTVMAGLTVRLGGK